MTPVGLDIFAQRRHLERLSIRDNGDGAMLDPGRHRLEARRGYPRDHRLRQCRGRKIGFANRKPEQKITHRAADHARLFALAVQHGEHIGQRFLVQEGDLVRGELLLRGRACHFVTPG